MADDTMHDPAAPPRRRSTVLGGRLLHRRYLWLWFIALALPGYVAWNLIILAEVTRFWHDVTAWLGLFLPMLGMALVIGWGLLLQRFLRPPPMGRHLLQFAVGAYVVGSIAVFVVMCAIYLVNDDFDVPEIVKNMCWVEAISSYFLPLIYGLVTLTGIWRLWRRYVRRERQAIHRDEGIEPRRGAAPTATRRRFASRLDAWGWWRLLPLVPTLLLPGWIAFFLLAEGGEAIEVLAYSLGVYAGIALVLMGWGKLLDLFTRRPPYAGTNLILATSAVTLGTGINLALMLIFDWRRGWDVIVPAIILVSLVCFAGVLIVVMTVWLIARTVILRFRDQRLELADIHEDTQSWKDLDR